jgi:hypothetical protein
MTDHNDDGMTQVPTDLKTPLHQGRTDALVLEIRVHGHRGQGQSRHRLIWPAVNSDLNQAEDNMADDSALPDSDQRKLGDKSRRFPDLVHEVGFGFAAEGEADDFPNDGPILRPFRPDLKVRFFYHR